MVVVLVLGGELHAIVLQQGISWRWWRGEESRRECRGERRRRGRVRRGEWESGRGVSKGCENRVAEGMGLDRNREWKGEEGRWRDKKEREGGAGEG